MSEIWVAGATGRAGRAIAEQLLAGGRHRVVLVGRNAVRLEAAAAALTTPGAAAPGTVRTDDVAELITRRRPDVVVNTVGPFGTTAVPTARACLSAGSHYVDLANEIDPVLSVLELAPEAAAAGLSCVVGAGFGVLATEALVYELCAGRPQPDEVRVAAMPIVDSFGPAVLASVLDAAAAGGRAYRGGRLIRTRLGADVERTPLPSGESIRTVVVPTGELEAARRASGAPQVSATSSEVPTDRVSRLALPVIGAALRFGPARRGLVRLAGRLHLAPPAKPGEFSWAYARVSRGDEHRAAWLRTGEGYLFTGRVAALVATRLADGEGRHGAYTPGALFGADLARAAGATILAEDREARA